MELELYAIQGGILSPMPLPERTSKGGTKPGHVWITNALHDYHCEGLNPFSDRDKRRYALGCNRVVTRGQKYLRKAWLTVESCEVSSRHCVRCAPEIERAPVRMVRE